MNNKTLATTLLIGMVVAASGCVSTEYEPPTFEEQVQTEVERSDVVKQVTFNQRQIKVTIEDTPSPEYDEQVTVQKAVMNGEEQEQQPFKFQYNEGENVLTIHSDENGFIESDTWDTEIRFNYNKTFQITSIEREGLIG